MKKETSNPLKKLAVVLLIPAACLFFWAFSEPEYHVTITESAVSRDDSLKIRNDSVEHYSEKDKNDVIVITAKRNRTAAENVQTPDTVIPQTQGRIINITMSDETQSSDKEVAVTVDANNSTPLFIIDGKEISSSSINAISPDQIDSMSIVKGESALKIYGEKAKNGVVIITTKRKN